MEADLIYLSNSFCFHCHFCTATEEQLEKEQKSVLQINCGLSVVFVRVV